MIPDLSIILALWYWMTKKKGARHERDESENI